MVRTARRYRAAAVVVSLALAVPAVLVSAPPARACACGAVVTGDGVAVTDEVAVLRQAGGTEDIVMRLALTGAPRDAAWILPVPAPPTFALADPALVPDLVRLTAPVVRTRRDWFPPLRVPGRQAVSGAAAPPPVDVVGQVRVGPYEVATLAATDAGALAAWLAGHGYQLRPDLATGLSPYVPQRWWYVAVKLAAPAGQPRLDPVLPPLRVTFASAVPVYPMRLSALAARPQRLRLFVLAEHRVRASTLLSDPDVRFAGWLDQSTVHSQAVRVLLPGPLFLTRFDRTFPPAEVTDDLRFGPAPDAAYQERTVRTEPVYLAGLPAGPVLLELAGVTAVLVLVPLVAWLLAVRRRRGTGTGTGTGVTAGTAPSP